MKTVQANFADIRGSSLHNVDQVFLKILARTTPVPKSKLVCNLNIKKEANCVHFFCPTQHRNQQVFEERTASNPTNVTTNLDVSPHIPQIVHNYVSKHRAIWFPVPIKVVGIKTPHTYFYWNKWDRYRAASRILNLRHSGISIQELNPYSNTIYQLVRSPVNKECSAHGTNKISPP